MFIVNYHNIQVLEQHVGFGKMNVVIHAWALHNIYPLLMRVKGQSYGVHV